MEGCQGIKVSTFDSDTFDQLVSNIEALTNLQQINIRIEEAAIDNVDRQLTDIINGYSQLFEAKFQFINCPFGIQSQQYFDFNNLANLSTLLLSFPCEKSFKTNIITTNFIGSITLKYYDCDIPAFSHIYSFEYVDINSVSFLYNEGISFNTVYHSIENMLNTIQSFNNIYILFGQNDITDLSTLNTLFENKNQLVDLTLYLDYHDIVNQTQWEDILLPLTYYGKSTITDIDIFLKDIEQDGKQLYSNMNIDGSYLAIGSNGLPGLF
ncbi:hypothetical protein PPERSA_12922 [Pseudocohnilembus persalinus]|uniref:Uncharacterized protein n=1 Tax=Pseudocohnilembus persalinus TaxID=266149 RepID=A0A0V0R1P9_PSEPJ|nr:hypothetical protein PPERSA_12922 [Pseudocohnilembus persalinus]|eukprot:KRX08441.1 hypothetical protein PPERSA_12922 [Pseudocohnilembus persalinus]